MEFLVGRSLMNAMVNLGIESNCEEALYEVKTVFHFVMIIYCRNCGCGHGELKWGFYHN